MRKQGFWVITFLFLCISYSNAGSQSNDHEHSIQTNEHTKKQVNKKLVGGWKLVSWTTQQKNGKVRYPKGENPVGLLIYDSFGNMTVQIMDVFRPDFETGYAGTNLEELKQVFDGYIAYFGTYSIDTAEQSVTHHVQGIFHPGFNSSDFVRYYELSGDQLVLSRDKERKDRLTWLRIKN